MAQNTGILTDTSNGWVVATSGGGNIQQGAGGDVSWQCKDAINKLLEFQFDQVLFTDGQKNVSFTPSASDFTLSRELLKGGDLPPEPSGGYTYDLTVGGSGASGPPSGKASGGKASGGKASGGEEARRRPRIRVGGGLFPVDQKGDDQQHRDRPDRDRRDDGHGKE